MLESVCLSYLSEFTSVMTVKSNQFIMIRNQLLVAMQKILLRRSLRLDSSRRFPRVHDGEATRGSLALRYGQTGAGKTYTLYGTPQEDVGPADIF